MFKRIAIAASAATILVFLFGMTLVFAHAKYDSSTPAAESTITSMPASVQVTFTEELRAVTLNVIGPDGSPVSTGQASIDLAERTHASVPVRSGGAGRYTVRGTGVADDEGDSARASSGSPLMTPDPATTPAPAPTPPPPPPPPPVTTPAPATTTASAAATA